MGLFGGSSSSSTSSNTSNVADNRQFSDATTTTTNTTTNTSDNRNLSTYNAFPEQTAQIFFNTADGLFNGVQSILGHVIDIAQSAVDTTGKSNQAVISSLAAANNQQQQTAALGQGVILKDVLPYIIGGLALVLAAKFIGK